MVMEPAGRTLPLFGRARSRFLVTLELLLLIRVGKCKGAYLMKEATCELTYLISNKIEVNI